MVFTGKICEKNLWKGDILREDAVRLPASLLKMSLFHKVFFTHFSGKNQQAGFSIIGTLVGNG